MGQIATRWLYTAGVAWLGLCGLGTGMLWSYSQRPGDLGEPGARWTLEEAAAPDPTRPTLVLYIHPRCPCSTATMAGVERLQARFPDGFSVVVVFYEPEGAGAAWRDSALWRRALALRDATALPDPGGRLTARAGAMTSGVAGLYGPGGDLLFWGGLTASRGHEGDSLGVDAIAAVLRGSDTLGSRAAVYGCSILGECRAGACASEGTVP